MSGHNKWSKIKHKKGAADKNKSRAFSKLSNAISIAARKDPNPEFNPTLRAAIDRAKKENMPQDNIQRAINRAKESDNLQEFLIEAYGPEGSGIIIEGLTDNTNRSLSEIKVIFKNLGFKLAEPGSLLWSFEKTDEGYKPKFEQPVSKEATQTIEKLKEALDERDDVVEIYANV